LKSSSNRSTRESVVIILALLALGSIMVYGINQATSISAYFLILSVVFLNNKDKAFGIAILFILSLNPWGLFYYKPHNLVFPITSTVGLEYQVFFIFLIYIKYKFSVGWRGLGVSDSLKPFYRIYIIYLGFLVFYGWTLGTSLASYKYLVETVIVLSIFLIIPRIFDYESLTRFNSIVFTFTLILVGGVIFDLVTGGFFIKAIVFGRQVSTASTRSDELVRLTGGGGLALYSLINSLYYIIRKNNQFKQGFLWLVLMASLFFIFNTATRGWILAALFFLMASAFYYFGRLLANAKNIIIISVLLILGVILSPTVVKRNLSASFSRLSTVETLAEGDMTAGGTVGRWTERGPKVLTRFDESPYFGFGFSRITSEYWDHHVGNHTLLLTGGIVGLSIIWLSILSIIIFVFRRESNVYSKGIFVFGFALMSFMIIHSTNRIMPDFVQFAPWAAFLFALIFSNINVHLDFAKRQKALSNNDGAETAASKIPQ